MSVRRRLWSASDDELLRTLAGEGKTRPEIAPLLERTEKAIELRAGLLGVKLPRGLRS